MKCEKPASNGIDYENFNLLERCISSKPVIKFTTWQTCQKEIQYLIGNSVSESNLSFIFAQFYPTQKEKNAKRQKYSLRPDHR